MAIETIPRTVKRVGAYVDDLLFPCSRAEILLCAEQNEAPDLILDAIEGLPARTYQDLLDITSDIGTMAPTPH